jgi:hypothetical protein
MVHVVQRLVVFLVLRRIVALLEIERHQRFLLDFGHTALELDDADMSQAPELVREVYEPVGSDINIHPNHYLHIASMETDGIANLLQNFA